MHINGCHIVSTLDKNSADGFSSMISKKAADGEPVTVGPIKTQQAAVKYAMSWKDPASPPPMPTDDVEVAQVENTQPVDEQSPVSETVVEHI